MVRDYDPLKLSSPRIFLIRMLVFLTLFALIAVILYRQIFAAFMANPGLNGLILGVLAIGIIFALRQVVRLFPEVEWVNGFRLADPGLEVARSPVLLAPMASLLGDRKGRMAISQQTMRGIMDSIGTRLDESRDLSRYLTGLLVFLGLLGTFWGLIETIGSIGKVVSAMSAGADAATVFEDLKNGLARPLGGMGIAFSSSLFGLAGSLVLGFLDLQAGQAQNRFYTDLEDWLSTTVRDIGGDDSTQFGAGGIDLQHAFERLERVLTEGGAGRNATHALSNLAEGIRGLVEHMRAEQKLIREWAEAQSTEQREIRKALEQLAHPRDGKRS